MKWLANILRFSDEKQPVTFNLLRIALGLVIFYKGILFVSIPKRSTSSLRKAGL